MEARPGCHGILPSTKENKKVRYISRTTVTPPIVVDCFFIVCLFPTNVLPSSVLGLREWYFTHWILCVFLVNIVSILAHLDEILLSYYHLGDHMFNVIRYLHLYGRF